MEECCLRYHVGDVWGNPSRSHYGRARELDSVCSSSLLSLIFDLLLIVDFFPLPPTTKRGLLFNLPTRAVGLTVASQLLPPPCKVHGDSDFDIYTYRVSELWN